MKITKTFTVVDAHTTGTPIRVITGGIPPLKGATMNDRMRYMEAHYDSIRSCLSCEPRGAEGIVCAVLTPPVSPDADYGVFYGDAKGFQPMCGAGTLSVAKVLYETGMVNKTDPVTKIRLETPTGIITAFVEADQGEVTKISFENQPAFLYKKDVILDVEGLGRLTVDIGFGGNFFVIVDESQMPVRLNYENRYAFRDYMLRIIEATDRQIKVVHPLHPELTDLNQVLFYRKEQDANGGYTTQCVFGDAELDISPCGTGTCTRLAQRYSRGMIGLNEVFIQNSIYGGSFYATALREVKVGDYTGIVPKVSCSDVRITGMNQWVVEDGDLHKNGLIY